MKRFRSVVLVAAVAFGLSLGGCPASAPTETNLPAAQPGSSDAASVASTGSPSDGSSVSATSTDASAGVTTGLSGMARVIASGEGQTTARSVSNPNSAVNIDETTTQGPDVFGDGKRFIDFFNVSPPAPAPNNPPSPPPPPADDGSGDQGGSGGGTRGERVYQNELTGTDVEEVIGCCGATFNVDRSVAVTLSESGELTRVFVPGFALLPDMRASVPAFGTSLEIRGEVPAGGVTIGYRISITTVLLQVAPGTATLRSALVVHASGGSLTITGDATHLMGIQWNDSTMTYDATTSYRAHMFGQAPSGGDRVDVDTTQEFHFAGTLFRQ